MRSALLGWGFNTQRHNDSKRPEAVTTVLTWVERNARPVADLATPDVLRGVLDAIATKLDGATAAATVVNRKRAGLFNAIEYAVECGLLNSNPIPA
jgi:hypothetical protein